MLERDRWVRLVNHYGFEASAEDVEIDVPDEPPAVTGAVVVHVGAHPVFGREEGSAGTVTISVPVSYPEALPVSQRHRHVDTLMTVDARESSRSLAGVSRRNEAPSIVRGN